jgi:acyl-CoA thioesterase-1
MRQVFFKYGIWAMCGLLAGCSGRENSGSDNMNTTQEQAQKQSTKNKTIIFFGNSLTAGYGLEPAASFPALIQQKIDSVGLPYLVVNAGLSGETSAGGNSRIDWILKQPLDVFVLELGANDGLRGIPVSETRKNLQSILDKVKAKYPQAAIVIAGMMIPPNMGQQYANEFREIFPELARKNNAALIPFLLEGVGGEARLNLEDGIHPTAEGHTIVANTVWRTLQPVLQK